MARLKREGIAHVRVVDANGKAAGLVAIDDLLGSTCPTRTN